MCLLSSSSKNHAPPQKTMYKRISSCITFRNHNKQKCENLKFFTWLDSPLGTSTEAVTLISKTERTVTADSKVDCMERIKND